MRIIPINNQKNIHILLYVKNHPKKYMYCKKSQKDFKKLNRQIKKIRHALLYMHIPILTLNLWSRKILYFIN